MTQQIIGVIPARFESTRFPGKPLVPILGKSLIQRTFENAKKANFSEIVIATDDQRIFDHARSFGAPVFMTSKNCTCGTERIAEFLQNNPHYQEADAIVNIQGDEPCLNPEAISSAIQLLLNDSQASMATLVTPLRSLEEAAHSSIVKCVIDLLQNVLYFSRSLIPGNHTGLFNPQNCYYRHIGLYVYRPSFLLHLQKLPSTPLQRAEDLEGLKVLEYGFKIKAAVTDEPSIGVDHPEDINKVEQWLCKQNLFSSQGESVLPSAKD